MNNNTIISIPLDKIVERVSPCNNDQNKVDSIAQSISKGKPITPIVVRKEPNKDSYIVVDGNHRVRAHKKLGKSTIEATKESVDRTKLFSSLPIYRFTISQNSPLGKRIQRKTWGKNISGTKPKKRNVGVLEKISKSINPSEKIQ